MLSSRKYMEFFYKSKQDYVLSFEYRILILHIFSKIFLYTSYTLQYFSNVGLWTFIIYGVDLKNTISIRFLPPHWRICRGVTTPLQPFKESNKTKHIIEDNPLKEEEQRKSCMFVYCSNVYMCCYMHQQTFFLPTPSPFEKFLDPRLHLIDVARHVNVK